MGMFGENFTTEGLLESNVFVGDKFSIGSAEVVVTQPRLPCHKLGFRFESEEMVKRFLASARTGFYLAVTREGAVAAEDEIVSLIENQTLFPWQRSPGCMWQKDTVLMTSLRRDGHFQMAALPGGWKDYFRERLRKFGA